MSSRSALPQMRLSANLDAWPADIEAKASAVLALFIRDPEQGLCLLFTRRASAMRSHAGQVGFPGGRREHDDATPAATALREAWEEIGLDPSTVEILGVSKPLRSLDLKPVIPVVAISSAQLSELTASPDEVDSIFLVPWEKLKPSERSIVRFNIFGRWRETPFYEANGHHIWGLTAWMIDQLGLA